MKSDIKKRLAYLRNRFRLAGMRLADGKFEVFNTAPASLHVWKQVDTLEEAVDLADQLVEKHNDSTFNVWSPDQQQAYQVHNRGGELEVTVKPTKAVEPSPEKGPFDKRPWDEQMAEYWTGEKRERTGSSQKILVDGGVYRSATREGVPEGLESAIRDAIYYMDDAMARHRGQSPEALNEMVQKQLRLEDLLDRVKRGRLTSSDAEIDEIEAAIKDAISYLDGAFFRGTPTPEHRRGLEKKRRRLDTLLDEVGRMRTAAWGDDGTVDDVGFDGFIGVFDPDKDKKRDEADQLWVLDKMREQGRTNLPVVVDDDVLPVNGKTKKSKS